MISSNNHETVNGNHYQVCSNIYNNIVLGNLITNKPPSDYPVGTHKEQSDLHLLILQKHVQFIGKGTAIET